LWSFEITKCCLWSLDHQVVIFPLLCATSCVEVRELELCTPRLYLKFLGGGLFVEDPIVYSWNPSVWMRGRRAVARTSKRILVFVFDLLSLNFTLYILHYYYCLYPYMLDIVYVLTLVFKQESYWSTSTLFKGIVRKSFRALQGEFRLTLDYTLCVCNLVFKFRILCLRLALHLFTPPLSVLSIGIRVSAPEILFNHLGVWSLDC